MLGYNQVTWDNLSGQEQQPASALKYWASLTENEKAGAALLGYNQTTWDNESGSELQPASEDKFWLELTACEVGKDSSVSRLLAFFIVRRGSVCLLAMVAVCILVAILLTR